MVPDGYPTCMQSFIISHSSRAEQYGDMSADTRIHSRTHTNKPPRAGVQLVGHTSIKISYCNDMSNFKFTRIGLQKMLNVVSMLIWSVLRRHQSKNRKGQESYHGTAWLQFGIEKFEKKLELKMKLVKALIWPVIRYGALQKDGL